VKYDIHHFVARTDGTWKWSSAGGADWKFGVSSPPVGSGIWFQGSGVGDQNGGGLFATPGFAGERVKTIQIASTLGTSLAEVDQKTGAFLIVALADEPVTLVTLDDESNEIERIDGPKFWDVCHTIEPLPQSPAEWAS